MDRFARIILGYHGAKAGEAADFAKRILVGEAEIEEWRSSENEYDWLGHGIYFWEHSPERARRWAGEKGVVVGAVIQLGRCLDLTDLYWTQQLSAAYSHLRKSSKKKGSKLPKNQGHELKNRKLDCLVINHLVDSLQSPEVPSIQTVRGAFEEGEEAFPGSMLKKETHIQVAVRDADCILGIFRSN